jgi:hypothetical protein
MSAYPVTLTHPDTGATYVASTRLEMMDALRNGWTLSADERKAVVAKTSGKKKASFEQAADGES